METREWSRGAYKVSTDASLLPLDTLNSFFASDGMYWASVLPEDVLLKTIQNSLNFGLYEASTGAASGADGLKLVGYARCITDYTTFMYLTDVYVSPDLQGKGLGKWMCGCVKEVVDEMPHLRRIMALTADWARSVPFYHECMGLTTIDTPPPAQEGQQRHGLAVLTKIGRGHAQYGK